MRKYIKLISAVVLVFLAFTSVLNASAEPYIFVGLTLNYDYTTMDATSSVEVITDNGEYWSVNMEITMNSVPYMNIISTVNKTAFQNVYNYTNYLSGSNVGSGDGFMPWIDTNGLSIGDNISIEGGQFKIMEQILVTVPMGTYTVFNATESNSETTTYHYYDITTGYAVKSENIEDNVIMVLISSNFISEFSFSVFPMLIIIITVILVYTKSIKK